MRWVIGVTYNSQEADPIGMNRKSDLEDLGIPVEEIKTMHVYFIQGRISEEKIEKACRELLSDNIIQKYNYINNKDSLHLLEEKNAWIVQVKNKPGVTDAVGESTRKGLLVLGVKEVENVQTAFTYVIKGELTEEDVKKACEKSLANSLIQDYKYERV